MSDLRQAAQQALEALECMIDDLMYKDHKRVIDISNVAITALRTALAQEHDLARLGQEIEQGKRGSIALARSLCYEIAGATSEDDMDGGGYGSVDIAEILSAEVVRLKKALAQPEQEPVAWAVQACSKMWRGEFAEIDAKAEAKRIGGTCVAYPLYTAQRDWAGLTDEDWEKVANRKNTVLDTFEQGAVWAAYKLERRNT